MLRPTSRIAPRAAIATTLAFLTLVSGVRAGMAETFAYVGNADSNDISVFKMAESGEMMPVQTAAFTGVEKPGSSTPLAITPDKRVLIAVAVWTVLGPPDHPAGPHLPSRDLTAAVR